MAGQQYILPTGLGPCNRCESMHEHLKCPSRFCTDVGIGLNFDKRHQTYQLHLDGYKFGPVVPKPHLSDPLARPCLLSKEPQPFDPMHPPPTYMYWPC